MEPLSADACRALGSLLEKQVTVPTTYPMTLNAVVAACNQTTGRDPVVERSEPEVEAALDELRQLGLVRLVHPSHGARTVKYRQVADDALGLDDPSRAVITVLLLRGAQTPGELRARTERLHPFEAVEEVEATLERIAGLPAPLVAARSRRPGQKEVRWTHLLDGAGGTDGSARSERSERSEPTAAPAASVAPAAPAEVAALAAFIGVWVGRGDGRYPTISPFAYTEEIELRPVPGKPILTYRSSTKAADDGRTLHGESGFWRLVGPDAVELVVAQGAGLVEVGEGLLEADVDARSSGPAELVVAGRVSGTSSAKEVTATERRYRAESGRLVYELAMAAVGQPLQPHLRGELGRG